MNKSVEKYKKELTRSLHKYLEDNSYEEVFYNRLLDDPEGFAAWVYSKTCFPASCPTCGCNELLCGFPKECSHEE